MIEFKRASNYDIHIKHAVNGGCIVQVGCCEVAFSNAGEMLEALTEYYKNPEEYEKSYNRCRSHPMGTVEVERRDIPRPGARALRDDHAPTMEDCECEQASGSGANQLCEQERRR